MAWLWVVSWGLATMYSLAFLALRRLHSIALQGRRRIHLFHLAAAAGGGGEKCLFALLEAYAHTATPHTLITLYISADRCPHVHTLLTMAESQFGISLQTQGGDRFNTALRPTGLRLRLKPLRLAKYLNCTFRAFQHLCEIFVGLLVAVEAAFTSAGGPNDEIWDTQGLPVIVSTYSLLTSILGRPVYTYTHWPWVNEGFTEFQDLRFISPKSWYRLFLSQFYRTVGKVYSSPVIANSTFTLTGLQRAWKSNEIVKVLPPVDLSLAEYATGHKDNLVLSIAQFRPEKNHAQQIRAIARLLYKQKIQNTRFCICGSLPSPESEGLAIEIFRLATECCGSKARVSYRNHSTGEVHGSQKPQYPSLEIHVNIDDAQLTDLKSRAKVGLHTMEDEHFGIVVVDLLVAGAVVVAHRSGGPMLDILRRPDESEGFDGSSMELGLLAKTDEEFADALNEALAPSPQTCQRLALAHTVSAKRFLDSRGFGNRVLEVWHNKKLTKDDKSV
eukprot:Protomagalhaensia_wolfi_Nauph_80__1033@NODE_159_length_3373_cov_32_161368_g120_i0_p1_GENE_NODE_159_length_3373_cov_32_161368_g120_i0NODE_159_length_3373_cov_32_161368_g120_i0_p1_ORF_typecomplete_len501_score90_76ALG11_N/PF15924_5/3_9e18Glycos_transf_1/PF00534_20/4_4e03Glycos_transf_1/PF00534_20/2e15Glyco_trans_1_4/PF13692_6/1_2e08_NODE_159_length_3373_cov_32_161368_g120_i0261528